MLNTTYEIEWNHIDDEEIYDPDRCQANVNIGFLIGNLDNVPITLYIAIGPVGYEIGVPTKYGVLFKYNDSYNLPLHVEDTAENMEKAKLLATEKVLHFAGDLINQIKRTFFQKAEE